MRKLLLLAFVLSGVAGGSIRARSQTLTASDFILASEHAGAKAAVEHDVETFAKYLSDEYVLINFIKSSASSGPSKLVALIDQRLESSREVQQVG